MQSEVSRSPGTGPIGLVQEKVIPKESGGSAEEMSAHYAHCVCAPVRQPFQQSWYFFSLINITARQMKVQV